MAPAFTLNELQTPRLTLRQLAPEDARQLHELRSDERVNRYLDRAASATYEEAVQFVNKLLASNAYYWAIQLKNQPELIGTVCLWNADRENSVVEIGYELLPQFQGKGLMTEAVQAIIAYNASVLKFGTIMGTTHIDNIASIKLLEKNHFIRDKIRENEFHQKGGSFNEIIFSLQQT